MDELVFLKLGGSLITDKRQPRTPRLETLARAAQEIRTAQAAQPELRLVIGHGAGSFAHVPAKKYGTRQGVRNQPEWLGFAEVWWEAAALNRLVMDSLHAAGLPVIALPPSAAITAREGRVQVWDLAPLKSALSAGLLPVVFGDVIFDLARGGTILSTEDLFAHLARTLLPRRILLAGIEAGVWADFPACTRLAPLITPQNYPQIAAALGSSNAADVTGGMASKVQGSLELVEQVPGLEVAIFSGETAGNLQAALLGKRVGTTIRAAA
ncbi:MAG: isopentenyl phosphate kinase [Anaerolineales bacterium]|nr:isopentenyl phosphate kinase [Anaerolineales bacterium]